MRAPIGSTAEQDRIVEKVEDALSVDEHLQETIDGAVERITRLRQSILRWALRASWWTKTPMTNQHPFCLNAFVVSVNPPASEAPQARACKKEERMTDTNQIVQKLWNYCTSS